MLGRLVYAVCYCIIVLLVTWLLTVLVAILPLPGGIEGVVNAAIWVVGIIICILVVMRLFAGSLPAAP
jgi:hypothetical protein